MISLLRGYRTISRRSVSALLAGVVGLMLQLSDPSAALANP
jgi:hypothetical protein